VVAGAEASGGLLTAEVLNELPRAHDAKAAEPAVGVGGTQLFEVPEVTRDQVRGAARERGLEHGVVGGVAPQGGEASPDAHQTVGLREGDHQAGKGVGGVGWDPELGVSEGAALANRGIDAVHVLDIGLAAASDVAVFDWAIGQDRVIVTRDYPDFGHLASVAQRVGRSFPGVLLVSRALRHDDGSGIAAGVERFARERGAFAPGTVARVTAGEG